VIIMDKKVVRELNAYLKGEYMAIKSYDEFMERIKDTNMKKELQNIQEDHKQHASRVADRIIKLGGNPVEGPGLMGTMSDLKNMVKRNSDATSDILTDAGIGEYRGIRMAEEIVKGDLDAESLSLIKDILDEDRGHVGRLGGFIH
jgi:bacterioferritin